MRISRQIFMALFLALAVGLVPAVGQAQLSQVDGQQGTVDTVDVVPTPREDGDGGSDVRTVPSRDAVRISGNRVEYMVIGPPNQSNAAIQVLTGAGAELRRLRDYPVLNRRALFFDFRNRLSVPQAQALLDQVAPQSVVDFHAIYRFAQGSPRLYATEMVGVSAAGCRAGRGMTIGMIDGPVDASHPALAGVQITAESVLGDGARVPNADHGTAVAILIGGQDPSGALEGFAGGARLHAVLAFASGRGGEAGTAEHIAAAIDRLLARNVRLINMSFAGPQNRVVADVLGRAAARGAVMIAAAGNSGQALAAYPAGYPDVIAVTAIDAGYRRYRRANYGSHIEFSAPGVDLYVANRRGAEYASGTSYAAPIITALAARLAPGGSTSTVRNRLRAAAVDLGAPGRDGEFGWGLVRAPGC